MKNKKLYPWIVVGLLWVVALLNYMDRQMLSTMKSAMMVDIVELESAANFGRLMAVFLWIYGFMSPVAVWWQTGKQEVAESWVAYLSGPS